MTSVLIIEDSPVMQKLLTDILLSDAAIQRVESAADPYAAWTLLKSFKPDAITLDIELPRMDGLTFLEKLMKSKPLPVVMVSASIGRNNRQTMRALELGAVDFIEKPRVESEIGCVPLASELIRKVKIAAGAKVQPAAANAATRATKPIGSPEEFDSHKVIAIGASTGGTEALAKVLAALPCETPGTIIVQHMPARFIGSFAERLNRESAMNVKVAADGERLRPGVALLAPGDLHLEIASSGCDRVVRTVDAPPVNRFRPSVDVLFKSVARHVGPNAIGVILTGMGCDGARGLLAMRERGAVTIAQDEDSCVVFGMPKESIAIGAVEHVRPLPRIASCILRSCSRRTPVEH